MIEWEETSVTLTEEDITILNINYMDLTYNNENIF